MAPRLGVARRWRIGVITLAILLAWTGCEPAPTGLPHGTASPTTATSPSQSAADPLRLVIDTDMAPDDVVAIAALLRDPAVEVLAITVVGTGEAHCPGGMFVARSIVTMLLPALVPVACGPREPLGDAQPFPEPWRIGADAGNGLELVSPSYAPEVRPAEELLVELAAQELAAGRRLTILTLGTLTNVAAAVALQPELADRVRLVSMLGAVEVAGNVTPDVAGGSGAPVAEWNAHADPTAVRLVLEADFDWTLIPLDATNSLPMSEDLYRALEADHEAGPADLVFELWSKNPFMWSSDYYLWDPVAAIAVTRPDLLATREATLRVQEGAGLDGGRLVEDAAGHPVTIATSADRSGIEAHLLSTLRIGGARANAFRMTATVNVAVGDRTCDARFDPIDPTAGLFRVEAANSGPEAVVVIAFALGSVTWAEVEAFVAEASASGAASPGVSPPPVIEVVNTNVGAGGTGSLYGESPPGEFGVACVWGSSVRPDIRLSGPFIVGP